MLRWLRWKLYQQITDTDTRNLSWFTRTYIECLGWPVPQDVFLSTVILGNGVRIGVNPGYYEFVFPQSSDFIFGRYGPKNTIHKVKFLYLMEYIVGWYNQYWDLHVLTSEVGCVNTSDYSINQVFWHEFRWGLTYITCVYPPVIPNHEVHDIDVENDHKVTHVCDDQETHRQCVWDRVEDDHSVPKQCGQHNDVRHSLFDTPTHIVSRSHTHPSHSQTSLLLVSHYTDSHIYVFSFVGLPLFLLLP